MLILPKNSIIGTLGPEFSFHDILRRKELGNFDYKLFENFSLIQRALLANEIQGALLATSNTTYGQISENINFIFSTEVNVLIEYKLPINLHLASKNTSNIDEIEYIYAHEVAWQECFYFLQKIKAEHLPSNSNAQALIDLKADSRGSAAAISGSQAITYHGLKILANNIDGNSDNTTTFSLVIKK